MAADGAECSAWAWGAGLAFGQAQNAWEPVKLSVRGRSLRGFSAAGEQALLVTQSGALWASGSNHGHWLFLEGTEETRQPEHVDLLELEGHCVEAAAGGQEHIVAILEEGQRVLSWGRSNEFGQLGHGSTALARVRPRAVALPPPRVQVRQVACGEMHSLVLTVAGTLFAFGDGSHGALGLGDRASVAQPTQVEVGEVRGTPLRAVAAGAQHSLALSLGGSVLSWGNAKHGRLALGPSTGDIVASPDLVPHPQELVRFISAGGRHSAVILQKGVCLLAGDNQHGQLGFSPAELNTSNTFMPIEGRWRAVALGGMHTLLLSYDGHVYSSGLNDVGQLGWGSADASSSSAFRQVKLPPSEAVIGIVAGPDHCMALTAPMQDLHVPKRTASLGEGQLRIDVSKIMRTGSDNGETSRRAITPGPPSLPKVSEDEEMSDTNHVKEEEQEDEDDDEPLSRSYAYTGSRLCSKNTRPCTAPANLVNDGMDTSDPDDELPRTLSGGCRHTLSKEIRLKLKPIPEQVKSSSTLETLLRPMAWPGVCTSARFAGLDVPSLRRLVEGVKPKVDDPSASEVAELRRSLCAVLATPSLLNASFCFPGLRRPRIDATGLVSAFSALWQTGLVAGRLEAQLREAISQGLKRWAGDSDAWADVPPPLRRRDQVRGLATLLSCPLISQTDSSPQSYSLMELLISLIASLPADGRIAFVNVVIEDMIPVLRSVLVLNVRRFCNAAIRRGAQVRRMGSAVWNGLLVLDLLAFANQSFQRQIHSVLPPALAGSGDDADLTRTISQGLLRSRSLAGAAVPAAAGAAGPSAGPGGFAMLAAPVPAADLKLEALDEDVVPADVEFALFMQNAQTRIPSSTEVLTLRPHDERLHSFMVHRSLLPTSFVRRVLQKENLFRQHVRQQQTLQDAVMTGQVQVGPGGMIAVDPSQMFFILSVRRDHLLEDTTTALQKAAPADLQRQIKVTFEGEDGQDAGGVSREFFRLLGKQLFSLQSQLFDARVAEEARVLWFDRSSSHDAEEFWLMGAIVGLAVYNNLPGLDVQFPVCTFKKLMGEPLGLEDMAEVQPSVASSLRALLAWRPPEGMDAPSAAELFEATFCLTFELSQEEDGSSQNVELKPGGKDTCVTLANREEFVQLYCQWVLERSVAKQSDPFKKGFSRTCDSPLFQVLTGSELAQIVVGESDLQLEDLRPRARYEGFAPDSQFVAWLWEILRGFDAEQGRRFLAFVTGSNQAPLGGLRELQLHVQKNGTDAARLPLAHTCFNMLLLPEYSSQERLREALLTAIENSEGFGLQ